MARETRFNERAFTVAELSRQFGAWGIAYCFGAKDTLPNGIVPEPMRRMLNFPDGPNGNTPATLAPFPNPASDRVMLTLPEGIREGCVQVFDSRGNLMQTISVHERAAFVEADVRNWNAGLYLARLLVDGSSVAETKFTVTP